MPDLALRTFDDVRKVLDDLGPAPPKIEVYAGSQAAVDTIGTVPAPATSLALFGIPIMISTSIPADWLIIIPTPPDDVKRMGTTAVDNWRKLHPMSIVKTAVHA